MRKHSCCFKHKLRKGLWSPDEDDKLSSHIIKYGHGCWSSVPKQAGLQRCGKSCRLRWINYLRPDLKRGTFTVDEENLIVELHKVLGNRWSQIAAQLPGRTDNEIKNLWNSCLKKKLRQKGIDPVTHILLSEVENSDKTNVITTTNSIDAVSGSNQLNLNLIHHVNNSKSNASILGPTLSSVSAQKYSSELESNLKMQTSEIMGYLANQPLDYTPSSMTSMNPTSNNLWFTQQNNAKYGMNSEFSSISDTIPVNPKSSNINTSFDMNNNRHYWEMGASSNSSSENNYSIENSLFSWENYTSGRESQILSMENTQENIKWPEILRNPFLMAAATFQNQPFYSEIKTETQFDSSRDTSDIWTHYNQQQQEPLQTSDICTVAFRHI